MAVAPGTWTRKDGVTTWIPPSAEEVYSSMDGYLGVFKEVTVFDVSHDPEWPLLEVHYPQIAGADTVTKSVSAKSFIAKDGGVAVTLSNGVTLWHLDGHTDWQVLE